MQMPGVVAVATLETAISFTQGTAWGRGLFQARLQDSSSPARGQARWHPPRPAAGSSWGLQPSCQALDLQCPNLPYPRGETATLGVRVIEGA